MQVISSRTLLSASVLFGITTAAPAATKYWMGGFSTSWGDTANWSSDEAGTNPALFYPTSDDVAVYTSSNGVGAATLTLVPGGARNVQQIRFSSHATGGISISNTNGGHVLTLNSLDGLLVEAGTGTHTLSFGGGVKVDVSNDNIGGLTQVWTHNGASQFTIGSVTAASINLVDNINATVNGAGLLVFGTKLTGNGSLTKNGTGTLRMGAGAGRDSTFTGGVTVNQGRLLFNTIGLNQGNWNVGANGILAGVGTVTFASGNSLGASGTVRPGNANNVVGTFTVNGNATLSATATTDLDLESTSLYDQLVVNGALTLNGNANVQFLSAFQPVFADAFPVITAGSLSGVFNTNAWGMIPVPGGAMLPEYTATTVVLKEFTRVGDVDFSGNVNNQDIAPFVAALTGGTIPAPSSLGFAADINGDGSVNNQDIAPFVALLTGGRPLGDFASDPDFAPLVAVVPEPASLSLLALGGLLGLRRRR
jgi:autotransporter-associated beta strand protein